MGATDSAGGTAAAPVSARRRATREKLLDAAHRVFIDRGVAVATIEEICEAAGFTRGAFYSNFTDKDSLVLALLERETDMILAALDRLHEPPGGDNTARQSHDGPTPERIVERFLSGHLVGREHYLIHTELALSAARLEHRPEAYDELANRQWERTTQAIRGALLQAGLEPIIDEADFAGLLYAILERSINQAITTGIADSDDFARRVLPVVITQLTRPVA